jgi:cation:H+ antiporter
MIDLTLPLGGNILTFAAAAAVIGVLGVRMAGYADELADRMGLGEAITEMVMLGLSRLYRALRPPLTAAVEGYPGMAISNALGGIAVQTVALAAAWRSHYNLLRPHSALGYRTPIEFANRDLPVILG